MYRKCISQSNGQIKPDFKLSLLVREFKAPSIVLKIHNNDNNKPNER